MTSFSICVPVYNVEMYLFDCIMSVLNQTFQDFELILVDDGSTDRSGIICDNFKMKDDRILVFHNENHGLMYSRQFAISKASGKYILYLDSDDTLESNALEVIFSAYSKHDVDCIVFGIQRKCNGQLLYITKDSTEEIISDKRILYKKLLSNTEYNMLARKTIKTVIAKEIDFSSFFHIFKGEDLVQSLYLFKQCNTVLFIPTVLYNYNINPNSIIQSSNKYCNYHFSFEVPEIERNFLLKEKVFSVEDWKEYKTYKIYCFLQDIKVICKLDTNIRNKVDIFKSISTAAYYNAFLLDNDINRAVLKYNYPLFILFNNRHYMLLIFIVKIYAWLLNFIPKQSETK